MATAASLPDPWPKQLPEPRWQAVLGTGWSSPVVAEGRVIVTDRRGHDERVLAFEPATGRPLWSRVDPVDFDPHQVGLAHGNGPKSTPAIYDGKVYTLGIAGRAQCLDAADGKQLWEINFPERYGRREPLRGGRAYVKGTDAVIVPVGNGEGAPVPLFGYTGSLLLTDGMMICSVGGERAGTIMAFNAANGEEVWRALDEPVSYSSPVVGTLAGRKQVVVMTGPEVVGLDVETGEKLWGYPFQIQYNESISTPVIADPYVLVTGDGKPLTALKITSRGDGCSLTVSWESYDLSSYLSSMLVDQGNVFGMNDGGEFVCLHLTDGKLRWRGGNHSTYCSPVLVGARLFCLNERGELLVLAADSQSFRPLGSSRITSRRTFTTPAMVGSRMYVRGEGELLAFDFAEH